MMARWTTAVMVLGLWGCETLEPNPGPQPGGGASAVDASVGGDLDAGLPGGDAAFPAGDGGGDAAIEADASAEAERWADGRLLYFRYCAVCHGADGTGGPPWPESIRNLTETYEVVHEGRGEMPGFPSLSADDVLAIELFLSDDGGEVAPDDPGPPPDVELPPLTPREQYATECAVCHGVEGGGTARGPQVRFPVRDYATWVVRRGRSGYGYPEAMEPYPSARIADAALAEIWDWLHGLPRPVDGEGLYAAFCGNCHGPGGSGGWVEDSIRGEPLYEYFYVVREGEGGRDYGDREDYMPAWSEAELSNEEIQAIWLYVTGGFPIDDDDDDDHDEDHDEGHDEDDDHDEGFDE